MERSEPRDSGIHSKAAALVAAALAGLLLFAYRELLLVGRASWASHLEAWFFEPNRLDLVSPVLVAGWLVFLRRARLRRARPAIGPAGASGLLAVALLGWSTLTGAPEPAVFSLALAGLALALCWGGIPAARQAALPLVLLLFAVRIPAPLYNALMWKLQLWTTDYVAWLLGVLGVALESSGDLISIGNVTFEVIESCTGLRIAKLLTLVAFAMAEAMALRRRDAVLFVVLAPAVGLFANSLRALWIALAATPEASAHHLGQGIITFSGACLLQYALGRALRRFGGARPEPVGSRGARGDAGAGLAAVAVAAALAAVSFAVPTLDRTPAPGPGLNGLLAAPTPHWEWEARPPPLLFLGATRFGDAVQRVYRRRDAEEPPRVELFAGVGALDGRPGSPFGPKTLLPGTGWVVDLQLPDAPGISGTSLRSAIVRSGDARMLIRRYVSGERGVLTESVRALTGLDVFDGARRAVVRLGTSLAEADAAEVRLAADRLDDLTEALREPLERILLGGRADPKPLSATPTEPQPGAPVALAAGAGPLPRRP